MKPKKPFNNAEISQRAHDHFAQRIINIETNLRLAIAETDAVFAFQALCTSSIGKLSDGYKEVIHGTLPTLIELGAFYLYPGFNDNQNRNSEQIQKIFSLLEELNSIRGMPAILSRNQDRNDVQESVTSYHQTVRGHSYLHQIKRKIEEILIPHDQWFRSTCGIGPKMIMSIVAAWEIIVGNKREVSRGKLAIIRDEILNLFQQFSKSTSSTLEKEIAEHQSAYAEEINSSISSSKASYAELSHQIPSLTMNEWNSLKEFLGITPERISNIKESSQVQRYPFYFLPAENLLLFSLSPLFDVVFEFFDKLARTNTSFKDKIYTNHVTRWMEATTAEFLKKVFPEKYIFTNVTYPNPDAVGGETELDTLVCWGPFVVFLEIKGRQYREESKEGNFNKLKRDIKDNIESAFTQTIRARTYFETAEKPSFKEIHSGRIINPIRNKNISIFQISITLHHFSGLATQLARLKSLGLFVSSNYPWSLSLSDLEIVCQFSRSPEIFLHYAKRRLDLQYSEENIRADELDLFGTYLNNRLHPAKLWGIRKDRRRPMRFFSFTGGAEIFDDFFLAKNPDEICESDIKLSLPQQIYDILNHLRRDVSDDVKVIIFYILDLSNEGINKLTGALANIRELKPPLGQIPRITFRDQDIVISVIGIYRISPEKTNEQCYIRCNIEKYTAQAPISIIFAVSLENKFSPYETAMLSLGPWQKDEEMDKFAKEDKSYRIEKPKSVGRNSPCYCGSGKKFKKCCINIQ